MTGQQQLWVVAMATFTLKMENPQIFTHIHKSLTFTAFDVKWIPISARFVALGSNPNSTGAMEIYELEGTDVQLRKKITKPIAFKCGTFGAASKNTRHLATGNFDGQLDVWDLENTDNPVYSAKGHQKIINSIDGIGGLDKGFGAPELVTGGRDGAVKVWDIRQPDEPVANMEPAKADGARDCWVVTFGNSYNNEERCVCAGYDNGDIKLFDLRAMKTQWETNVKNGVCCIDFNRKDIKLERLVVTTLESNYHVFDMKTQNSKNEFPSFTKTAHKGTIWCVKHSPQNRDLFMTTGGSGSVCLWKHISPLQANNELGSVELLREEMVSSQPISSLDWSPDKQGLAVCTSFDQAFRLLILTKLNRF